MSLEIPTQTVQQLMEVAYVASGAGMLRDSEIIFQGVQAACPESVMPQIGRAVNLLNAGRPEEATQLLRAALDSFPESELAMSFLGLALRQAGFAQAMQSVCEQVVALGQDQEALALAQSLLDASSSIADNSKP
ncbi:MAG: hypothetical protein KDA80_14900 [Planctomycetaceae bacterium]|nr:hypothetical protein [Planctomycetaceae bacterium]